MARKFFIGIDIGGTFTDLVLAEDTTNNVYNAKTLTTPADPVQGVMNAVRDALGQAKAAAAEVERVAHATTLATNLVLEAKGARVAFITTDGFGDMFEISKQQLPASEKFNILADRPPPLVSREMVVEAKERLNAQGEVLQKLDEEDLQRKLKELAAKQPQAVAICLLHSYANPVHEQRVAALVRQAFPKVYVTISSEVWPQFQEYERASTTVVSAYVGPLISEYLERLSDELRVTGINCTLQVMQSAGSVMAAPTAARKAVYSVESGPAAGVIAAAELGKLCGCLNVMSFDMGGTTAKVGLVRQGRPHITHNFRIGTGLSAGGRSGEPIRIPVIDLAEVGAGGGSIAWLDSAQFLQIGPHSAGAQPGPACYGFGGEQPTVTDANVVLGYLNPDYFLGGKMKIFPEKSSEAIAKSIAQKLKVDVPVAAHGIYQLANSHMGSAVRVVTVQRGIDPREYVVMAFGGAGPIHIVRVAEQFEIPTIMIPPSPGVASAFGLLMSDLACDNVATRVVPAAKADAGELAELFQGLEGAGRAELRREGLAENQILIQRTIDARFVHQKHELTIPVVGATVTAQTLKEAEQGFRDLYFEMFGIRPTDPCEFVNFGVRAVGLASKPQLSRVSAGDGNAARGLKGARKAYFGDAFVETKVYDRKSLQHGDRIQGPAIIEEPDSTTICPPAYSLEVDPFLNLVIHNS